MMAKELSRERQTWCWERSHREDDEWESRASFE